MVGADASAGNGPGFPASDGAEPASGWLPELEPEVELEPAPELLPPEPEPDPDPPEFEPELEPEVELDIELLLLPDAPPPEDDESSPKPVGLLLAHPGAQMATPPTPKIRRRDQRDLNPA
jgi:protein TonB